MKINKINPPYNELLRLQKYTEKLLKTESLQPAFKFTLYQLRKDTIAALSFWKNVQNISEQKRLLPKYDKLQIGGGKHYLPDFINLDLLFLI